MVTGQEGTAPFFCPRCGGPMYKPAGSSFYWHATGNHPPCSITNVAEVLKIEEPAPEDTSEEQPKGQPKKKH
ncbi:MAG TPA: hypothetical protein VFB60_28430 [Ktedonobacteraceae bacterium]|nr:hypothetical protein [Ktedonobacteraceae bacterium]